MIKLSTYNNFMITQLGRTYRYVPHIKKKTIGPPLAFELNLVVPLHGHLGVVEIISNNIRRFVRKLIFLENNK